MANPPPSRRWWILGVIVAGVAALLVYLSLPPAPLAPHTGDGEFTDLSWRIPVFGLPLINVPGFAISMPRFDLGKDHAATYRVSHLPDIGQKCHLYLAIDDPQNRWLFRDAEIRKLQGSLRLEVLEGQGKILSAEQPLGQSKGLLSAYVWSNRAGVHRLYPRFGPSALDFQPRPGMTYTFRVVYQAEPALAGYEGYCYLECGGRGP